MPLDFYTDKNIGQTLKQIRESIITPDGSPLSQLDLSCSIGWENPSTLSRIENNEVIPTRDTLIKICKGLCLNDRAINFLLQKVQYFDNVPILTEEYINKFILSIKEDFDDFKFPIMIKLATTIIYVNKEFERIILNNGNIRVKDIIRKSFIDILFDPYYGLKQRILNWDIFSKELVENLYIVYSALRDTQDVGEILSNIDKYTEFNDLWNSIDKNIKMDKNVIHLSQRYNSDVAGEIDIHLLESTMPNDNRFLFTQYHY